MLRNQLSKVAVLAVLAAMAGCAAPTEDNAESVGTAQQAEGAGGLAFAATPGEVLSIITMMSSVKSYGVIEITSGRLLDELVANQAKIAQLKTAMQNLESTLTDAQGNVLSLPTTKTVNTVSILFDEYQRLVAAKDEAGLAKLYAALPTKEGGLNWEDLGSMNDYLSGTASTTPLLGITARQLARQGMNGASSDPLGTYFAHMRMVQEKAFMMLASASVNDPGIDLAVQKTKHQARMRDQARAFRAATNEYFELLVKAAQTRTITECACSPDEMFGVCAGLIPTRTASFSFFDGESRNDYSSQASCEAQRQPAIDSKNGDIRRGLYRDFFATQKTFTTTWPSALGAASEASSIKILDASYGDATDRSYASNVTGQMAAACNGLQECTFPIDDAQLGSPSPNVGVQKIIGARFRCDDGAFDVPGAKTVSATIFNTGSSIIVSCPVTAGSVDDVLGNYVDPNGGADNQWAQVSITKLTSAVVMWTNKAGAFWTLSLTPDANKLDVSPENSYYQNFGYEQADVKRDASGKVTAIVGPMGTVYGRVK